MKKLPICPRCLGYLLKHPTLNGWLKCVGCGFSRKENE